MGPKARRIERVRFGLGDPVDVVEHMRQLTDAGDGWINLVPTISDDDEMPPTLGFFTLLGGGGTGATGATWIPAEQIPANRPGNRPGLASLGITHVAHQRVVAKLASSEIPIPAGWRVEQDHPSRGVVIGLPAEDPPEDVLGWALRAVAALAPGPVSGWQAEVHLPATPGDSIGR